MGVSHEAMDEHEEWQFLTTQEKWTRWCHNTNHAENHDDVGWFRPLKQAAEDMNMIRFAAEEKRDRDRARMRKMISQGVHRTKEGLQLTAPHLPKDMDHESVRKYRRECLDKVDQQSRRIRQAITYTSTARHELKHCKEALASIEPVQESPVQDSLLSLRSKFTQSCHKNESLSFDMVNDFNEKQLSPEEQHMRLLARSIGMPLPDAEAVRAQFNFFNTQGQGAGITWKNFPKMLFALSGEELCDAKVHELWRTIDKDGNGHISFDEYLDWHHKNCDAPHLGFHVHTDDDSQVRHDSFQS